MKTTINYLICILAAVGLSLTAGAQELASNSNKRNPDKHLSMDSSLNQRMESDLHKRSSMTKNQTVKWKDSGFGYYGTYTSDNVQYMARYDEDGNYVETLTRKDWNNNGPAKLKSLYGQSQYKSQKVTGYWEVINPARKGYYLELKDDQNKSSQVWVNEDGQFSTWPARITSGGNKNRDMDIVPDSTLKKDHQR